jgi:hypothetical protein
MTPNEVEENRKGLNKRRIFISRISKYTSESSLKEYLETLFRIDNLYLVQRHNKLTNIAYLSLKEEKDTE